jgi:hypothetical protein
MGWHDFDRPHQATQKFDTAGEFIFAEQSGRLRFPQCHFQGQ